MDHVTGKYYGFRFKFCGTFKLLGEIEKTLSEQIYIIFWCTSFLLFIICWLSISTPKERFRAKYEAALKRSSQTIDEQTNRLMLFWDSSIRRSAMFYLTLGWWRPQQHDLEVRILRTKSTQNNDYTSKPLSRTLSPTTACLNELRNRLK